MGLLDSKNPLWMPEGSVRSIGFLMMTATLCYLTAKGIISAEAFLAIAGLALKFYYDSKTGSNGNPPAGGATA